MDEIGREYTDLTAFAASAPCLFLKHALELAWGVRIALDLVLVLRCHIFELEVGAVAVAARDFIAFIILCLSGLLPNAKTANVVFAASSEHHVIEVPETDRAVELEVSPLLLFGGREAHRVDIQVLNVFLIDLGIYTHLDPVLQLLFLIVVLNLFQDSELV